jgi:hypothetical protein
MAQVCEDDAGERGCAHVWTAGKYILGEYDAYGGTRS